MSESGRSNIPWTHELGRQQGRPVSLMPSYASISKSGPMNDYIESEFFLEAEGIDGMYGRTDSGRNM